MESKRGALVRAVYDFPTDDADELPLLVGDLVQVKERVDRQWSRGSCAGREGNFPIGFTVDVKAPQLKEHQQLFAAISDFVAQESGDLTFAKGDLIIGHNPIDSNWWCGEKEDGSKGIFPITHVWKIDKSLLPVPSTNKKMFARARVKLNMTAQLPEEMDLYKDEIVDVFEEVEKGWYRGECNGRTGIFPASFVTILSEDHAQSCLNGSISASQPVSSAAAIYDNAPGYDCVNSGISSYGQALYPFQAEYPNELSLKGGEIVKLIRHIDNNWIEGEIDGKVGIFPSTFVNIIVDCPKPEGSKEAESHAVSDPVQDMFPPDTYGRVTRDFYPQLDGGVRLREGDTVTLIRKIDSNWYEVETDSGESGICPENYIEVIGSGPPSYSEVMASMNSSKYNSTSVDVDFGFGDDGKNASKSGRPSSFISSASDSSFSSQSSTLDRGAKGTTKMFDEKLSMNLTGFESSGYQSGCAIGDSSNLCSNYDNLTGQSSFGWDDASSSHNLSSRNLSFETASSPKPSRSSFHINASPIPKIVHTPARPPPPANLNLSENTSNLNCSLSSPVNSFRQSFSSVSSHSSSDSTECLNESDIHSQIRSREQVLKQRINCLAKLESEAKTDQSGGVSSELKTQISQLNEDIERIKQEIEGLRTKVKPSLVRTVSDQCGSSDRAARDAEVERKKEIEQKRREEEKKKKTKEQRDCIITEILQTERDYVSDLKLLHDIFLRNPEEAKSKGVNVMALFGNLDEVISVADRLLRRIQKTSSNDQLIGECFVDMSDEMKTVYGHYCRNHDEVNTLLDKIDPQSPAHQFIQHKLEILKRQTNVFDLGAMLIKPVQRILKYPLLLDQLFKCTEDDHPDKEGLKQAINIMSDVATAINEFKRQKDLVFKYRKQSDTSLSGRISKFNFHSMAKKSSRFGMRISSSIGLKSVTVNEEFDKVNARFNSIKKSMKIFLEDMNEYTKKCEELCICALNMAEGIAELYQEKKSQKEVEEFRNAHRVILTQFWEAFKQTVDQSIQSPIKQLLLAFKSPKTLVDKRYDKLLDYESSTNKLEKNKDATKIKMLQDTQQMAKNNYEALNSQLLNDLPKLCDLSVEILCDCVRCFLRAKKNFIGRTARLMFGLMDLPLMLSNQGSDVLETFQVKHTLVLDDLSRLSIACKQFQSCLKAADSIKKHPSPKERRLTFGSASQVAQNAELKSKIKSTYPEAYLYSACESYDAVDIMDITLKKGDLVGVVKQQDPMGNKTRWFVDKGDAKGFVPVKCLMKYLPDPLSFTNSASSWPVSSTSSSNFASVPPSNQAIDPQKSNSSSIADQSKSTNVLQPTRPAPPVATSLRVVAPSRYPAPARPPIPKNDNLSTQKPVSPVPDSSRNTAPSLTRTASPRPTSTVLSNQLSFESPPPSYSNVLNSMGSTNLNMNSNSTELEPIHRYEEIPDDVPNVHVMDKDVRLLGDSSIANATRSSTSNILDEFDPYSPSVVQVYDNVPDNLNTLYSAHRYEDIPEGLYYSEVPSDSQMSPGNEYYFALYDFTPTGPNQLQLRKGQVVLVQHKCDLNQNSEWWYVEDRHGSKGYVPALYLNKYTKDTTS